MLVWERPVGFRPSCNEIRRPRGRGCWSPSKKSRVQCVPRTCNQTTTQPHTSTTARTGWRSAVTSPWMPLHTGRSWWYTRALTRGGRGWPTAQHPRRALRNPRWARAIGSESDQISFRAKCCGYGCGSLLLIVHLPIEEVSSCIRSCSGVWMASSF